MFDVALPQPELLKLMKRCLIADQSEVVRRIVRHHLETLSIEVVEAESAEQALALCSDTGIDILILDWRLPGKTTIEILSTLRFARGARRPLIIYATTENDPAEITRAFSAGVDSYLLKPFDRTSFMETMTNAGLAA
jgi:two-component system chemotaxis response regulator CheY